MRYQKTHRFGPIESLETGRGYFGPPPVKVHSFFVDGLLIDTGPPNAKAALLDWLADKNLQQIFVTHHHEDHSGNVKVIQNQHNVEAYSSMLCADLVKGKVQTSIPQLLFWGRPEYIDTLTPIQKDVFETPNHRFALIPIPGHAPDQLALYEKEQGWLFSADAFVSPVIKYFMKKESMAEQIQSLKRLLALDFEWLLCCHKPLLKGGKEKLQQKCNFLEDYYGQVVFYHQKGHSAGTILSLMGKKELWFQKLLSQNNLSAINMVHSVLRDEAKKQLINPS